MIGSISKQVTAVLILGAYQDGTLGLHETIGKYLKDIKQPCVHQVTIHQLLTHTHGIVSTNEALAFEPDSQFQHSQIGYDLLDQVLQTITKKHSNNTELNYSIRLSLTVLFTHQTSFTPTL